MPQNIITKKDFEAAFNAIKEKIKTSEIVPVLNANFEFLQLDKHSNGSEINSALFVVEKVASLKNFALLMVRLQACLKDTEKSFVFANDLKQYCASNARFAEEIERSENVLQQGEEYRQPIENNDGKNNEIQDEEELQDKQLEMEGSRADIHSSFFEQNKIQQKITKDAFETAFNEIKGKTKRSEIVKALNANFKFLNLIEGPDRYGMKNGFEINGALKSFLTKASPKTLQDFGDLMIGIQNHLKDTDRRFYFSTDLKESVSIVEEQYLSKDAKSDDEVVENIEQDELGDMIAQYSKAKEREAEEGENRRRAYLSNGVVESAIISEKGQDMIDQDIDEAEEKRVDSNAIVMEGVEDGDLMNQTFIASDDSEEKEEERVEQTFIENEARFEEDFNLEKPMNQSLSGKADFAKQVARTDNMIEWQKLKEESDKKEGEELQRGLKQLEEEEEEEALEDARLTQLHDEDDIDTDEILGISRATKEVFHRNQVDFEEQDSEENYEDSPSEIDVFENEGDEEDLDDIKGIINEINRAEEESQDKKLMNESTVIQRIEVDLESTASTVEKSSVLEHSGEEIYTSTIQQEIAFSAEADKPSLSVIEKVDEEQEEDSLEESIQDNILNSTASTVEQNNTNNNIKMQENKKNIITRAAFEGAFYATRSASNVNQLVGGLNKNLGLDFQFTQNDAPNTLSNYSRKNPKSLKDFGDLMIALQSFITHSDRKFYFSADLKEAKNAGGISHLSEGAKFADEVVVPQIPQIEAQQIPQIEDFLQKIANDSELARRLQEQQHQQQIGNVDDTEQVRDGDAIYAAQLIDEQLNVYQGPGRIRNASFIEYEGEEEILNRSQIVNLLDFVFQTYNETSAVNEFKSKIAQIGASGNDAAVDKLYNVLSYFADQDSSKLSEKTQEMLKNNNAFINFFGWVLSQLPEAIQEKIPEFAQSWVKRYEFSDLIKTQGAGVDNL